MDATLLNEPRISLRRDAFIGFLFVALGLFGFMQGFMSAIMPFVRQALHLSATLVAWHFTAYALGRLASGVAARRMVDAQVGPTAIRSVAVCLIVAMASLAVAPYVVLTLICACLMGMSGGLLQALTQAEIGRLPGKTRELALGEAYVWAGLGVMLCPLAIGWIARHGWPPAAALALPGTTLLALWAMSVSAERAASLKRPIPSSGPPSLVVLTFWALVILGNAIEWGIGLWGPQFPQERHGMPAANAVSLMSFYFASTIVGRMINIRLLRWFDSDRLFAAYLLIGGVAVMVVLLSGTLMAVTAALSVAGAALGCLYPSNTATAMKYAPDEISRITAGAAKCSGVALLTIPLLLGYASDRFGLSAAILVLGGIPPLMLVLVLALVVRSRRQGAS
jgi:MFS family permease